MKHRQNLRYLLFYGKMTFSSWDTQFKSISTRVRNHFFWFTNHLLIELGQLLDTVMDNIFRKYFPLTISSLNVTKCTVSCGFGHIYWRYPKWKTSFFVQYWVQNPSPFLFTSLPKLITSYDEFLVFNFFVGKLRDDQS